MILLDIIIPHYKEKKELLDRALNSISIQEGIDLNSINVVVINDCAEPLLSDDLKNKYSNLNIIYINNEVNLGPGLTRQRGLDNSMAKYITFLDCDDEFYSNFALANAIDRMEKYNDNILVTSVLEEVFINGKSFNFKHMPNEVQGLHGIFYNREFLIKNNIRFHSKLWHAEDSYFYRISCYITKIDAIDYVTYKWNYNETSIVKQKRKFDYSVIAFKDHLNQVRFTYEFVKEKGCAYGDNFIDDYLISSVYGLFILLNSSYFNSDSLKKEKEEYKLELKRLYNDYIDIFNKLSDIDKIVIFEKQFKVLSNTNPKIKMPKDVISYLNKINE